MELNGVQRELNQTTEEKYNEFSLCYCAVKKLQSASSDHPVCESNQDLTLRLNFSTVPLTNTNQKTEAINNDLPTQFRTEIAVCTGF
jgi:hypothetical protein